MFSKSQQHVSMKITKLKSAGAMVKSVKGKWGGGRAKEQWLILTSGERQEIWVCVLVRSESGHGAVPTATDFMWCLQKLRMLTSRGNPYTTKFYKRYRMMVWLLNNSSKMETDLENNLAFAIDLRVSWNDIGCIQAPNTISYFLLLLFSSFASYPSYYLLELYNQFIRK